MYNTRMIEKLLLKDFRNFENKLIEFSDTVTIIVGDNATGKTNLLEAIYLIATGKSFKAVKEEEMVGYQSEVARVKAKVTLDEEKKLEVVMTRGKVKVGENPEKYEIVPRKKVLNNGVSKRLFDFAGNLTVVLFAPQDLDLVTESPSIRRKYLDSVLSQVDREYRRSLISYEKGVRQRNKLLFRIREEGLPRSQLLFWNTLLIKNGDYIAGKRMDFIEYVNKFPDLTNQNFGLVYGRSAISEERLEKYAREEIYAGKTLVGPHRDDFAFTLERSDRTQKALASFGSRGEQRMGVLWLKLAELAFSEAETGIKPTLLLDDIFSELDHTHRDVVMDVVKNQQTVITTADPHFVEHYEESSIINLN